MLVLKAGGPEFNSPAPREPAGLGGGVCNPKTREVETGSLASQSTQ